MKQRENDLFIVRSLSMMNYLVKAGFPVLMVEDATDNPHFKVFLFKNTRAFQKEVDRYLIEKKGSNHTNENKRKSSMGF